MTDAPRGSSRGSCCAELPADTRGSAFSSAGASATLPQPGAGDQTYTFPAEIGASVDVGPWPHYPDVGLETTGTITRVGTLQGAATPVYKVVAVSEPMNGFERIHMDAVTREEYYLASTFDHWDNRAYLVRPTNPAWTEFTPDNAQVFRGEYRTSLRLNDGREATMRDIIVATAGRDSDGELFSSVGFLGSWLFRDRLPLTREEMSQRSAFAPFDISGSLAWPEDYASLNNPSIRPDTPDQNVTYSSAVIFGYNISGDGGLPIFSRNVEGNTLQTSAVAAFPEDQLFVNGVRFYSEYRGADGNPVGTTLIYEEVDRMDMAVARIVTRQEVRFNAAGEATSRRQRIRITINPGAASYAFQATSPTATGGAASGPGRALQNVPPQAADAITRAMIRRDLNNLPAELRDWAESDVVFREIQEEGFTDED